MYSKPAGPANYLPPHAPLCPRFPAVATRRQHAPPRPAALGLIVGTLPFPRAAQDVLEKQADIIKFMKQRNESLTKRIKYLTERLDSYERGIQ